MENLSRRSFLGLTACAAAASATPAQGEAPLCRFLFFCDVHVERDWLERGRDVYTCWKPGNHLALELTYAFANADPLCRTADFALFGGDQLNTGYWSERQELEAEREIFRRTLSRLELAHPASSAELARFDFHTSGPYLLTQNLGRGEKPFVVTPPPLSSRVIAIQGNHDTGVADFYRECAFRCGGVKFITFFASYVGLPAPKGHYRSTASISDASLDFIARELASAASDPTIRRTVLVSHWAIAPRGPDFKCPILDRLDETPLYGGKMNDNRGKLLALVEKYGCDLYLNGHEHNGRFPVGLVGRLPDVNCGTLTARPNGKGPESGGAFALVEIFANRAVLHVHSRAEVAMEGGKPVVLAQPRHLFDREVVFAQKIVG